MRPTALPCARPAAWWHTAAVLAALALAPAAHAMSPPCAATPIYAHRGHPAHVENSAAAVRAATRDGFAGAEIDVQRLAGTDNWALHHDLLPGRVVALPADRPLPLLTPAEWTGARFVDVRRGADEGPALLERALAALPTERPPGWRLLIEVKDFPSLDAIRALVRQVQRHVPLSSVTFASLSSETLGYLRLALPPGSALAWVLLDPRAAPSALSPREWQLVDAHGERFGASRAAIERVLRSGARLVADPPQVQRAATALGPGMSLVVDLETLARTPALAEQARAAGVALTVYTLLGNSDDLARLLARLHHSRGFWPDAIVAGVAPAALCEAVLAHGEQLRAQIGAGGGATANAAPAASAGPVQQDRAPAPSAAPSAALPAPSAPHRFRW